ncbi:MAG: type II CAAX endopeptidase family protein [Candidatus Paceibacterota bacterium]
MESISDIKKERELVWLQILYLFLIPILLLYYKVIGNDFRILMLLTVAVLIYGIARYEKWNHEDFGIKKKWTKDFLPYLIFTICGVIFLFIVEEFEIGKPFLNWWKNEKFLLLFIPLSVLQEVIFRGVLMNMLRRVFKNPIFIIGLNASLFALMHVIYLNSAFVLPVTFVAGIGFAWMYYKYQNLFLISASHTILNFVGMILGFFVLR